MRLSHDRSTVGFRSRDGSFIVESVVSIALLATAFIALGNLAASSSAISRNADQRLAATLAAENVLERLQAVSFDAVTEYAPEIRKAMQGACGYDVKIETQDFRAGDRDAIHLIVTVGPNKNASITLHDWRFNDSASDLEGDDDE